MYIYVSLDKVAGDHCSPTSFWMAPVQDSFQLWSPSTPGVISGNVGNKCLLGVTWSPGQTGA